MTDPKTNPLHLYANWAANVPADWSELAISRARDAVIDTLAVTIPGAQETVSQKVGTLAVNWGGSACSIIGRTEKTSPPMAAMANGTAAHALDFDDNFDPAKAHASAVLVPALLALAEDRDKDGTAFLDAYIVGLQILGRVGQGLNPFHRSRGWHATATIGTVGTAAGCARLLGLDAEKTAHAISLSTSFAGGFMSQFGTMTKPLHAGIAAAGAVQAALFAEAGITAGDHTLEGKNGMGTLMVGPDVDDLRAIMKDKDEYGQKVDFPKGDVADPLMIEKYGLKVKRFPNCGSVHRALDGLLQLREKHGFSADSVTRVFVRAPAAHLRNLMYDRPTTSAEAKFSLEYGLAVGLLYGDATLADYEESAISRPEVQALLPLIEKEYVEKLESDFFTQVYVTLKSGEELFTEVNMPVGSSASPLSHDQLMAKFDACADGHLDAVKQEAIKEQLNQMNDSVAIKHLMSQLS
ncbi:2-methylcitrate dehydratase [Kordiimonas sediminis]|uniref:2-methylcitrate dehydratase n=1 Tax=Kordiimonas sediminis TaxID=1735581 RepID=A0A919AKF7_9PROT|nr:MmgE/PrpD family protein [Kordiimonas sediminis]GHF11851.1 2-methylcitrate dehydratase [Kordiimonas sediminis]